MSSDTSTPADRTVPDRPAQPGQPGQPNQPGPAYTQQPPAAYGPYDPYAAPPAPPAQPAPAAYGARPAPAYGARPAPAPGPVDHHYGPGGLVATPAVQLPPERVGRGALLALLAIPVGALLSAVIWRLGFVASLSGVVVAAGAAVLYARGSGGRVKKGIPVIAAVIVLGIVVSFFAAVATDLWTVFPKLDPEISGTYPSRGTFVSENLFYPPVLGEYTHDIVLFALFGVLGGFGTILRLVRTNASLQR